MVRASGLAQGTTYTVSSISGSGARVVGGVGVRGPGGATAAGQLAANFSRGGALSAAARVASRAVPVVGTAFLIHEVWSAWRAEGDGEGNVRWDSGIPTQALPYYEIVGGFFNGPGGSIPIDCRGSITGVQACMNQLSVQAGNGAGWVCNTGGCQRPPAYLSYTFTGTRQQCAPVPGIPLPLPGPDGRCPDGEKEAVLEPAHFAEKVITATDFANSLDYARMLREAVGHGDVEFPPAPLAPEQELVPGSVPRIAGPTTVTQEPDGTVTEVATGWNFARDPLRKNQGTWNPSETVTKKDAQGNVISTSTTETQPGDAPSANPDDPCTLDPGRLGCIGLGEVPQEDVPRSSAAVEFTPDVVDLAPRICPAPLALPNGQQLSFQSTCDAFETARPVVLASASLAALLIVLAALRSQ